MIKEHARKLIQEQIDVCLQRMVEATKSRDLEAWATAYGEADGLRKALQIMSQESIDAIPRWHLTSRAQDYEMIELHQEAKLIRDLVEFYDNIPKEKLEEFV